MTDYCFILTLKNAERAYGLGHTIHSNQMR